MAYTVVLEREHQLPPWGWYVGRMEAHRTAILRQGAADTPEIAAEQCALAFSDVVAEAEQRKLERRGRP